MENYGRLGFKLVIQGAFRRRKNRLLLAKLFTRPANLLILDEPTNDLDMETLDLLEELLLDYQGTVLLVSHDRSFLNNVVTSSLIFDGSGTIEDIIGGYDDWQQQQKISAEQAAKKEKAKAVPRKERPKQIEKLETEQAQLHETMADPNLYQQGDGSKIAGMQERLSALESELETIYQRWEELEKIPE